ncbi:MAG: response regulator transcription factor [Myxococcota bacterium]
MNDIDPGEQRLLVVEDEEHLAAGLKLNLELEGYAVDVASSARQAGERIMQAEAYDALVLDVMLPDLDGFALCRKLRDAGNFVPVIMLTARSSAADRVRGLEAGADDYMVKPFELAELLARVRSALRRRAWERDASGPPRAATLRFAGAEVDFEKHEVIVHGEARKLTRLELDLLRYFAENPLRVLSRQELLEKVWNIRNSNQTRTIDNFIARLRRHFEADASDPRHFLSVRGAGYKFVPDP